MNKSAKRKKKKIQGTKGQVNNRGATLDDRLKVITLTASWDHLRWGLVLMGSHTSQKVVERVGVD